MSQKKVYDLSEALKIVLLPDGNISDLEDDDYQSDDETKNLNPTSVFNNDEITMPEIGSLEFELQQAGAVVNESDISFEVLERCVQDATSLGEEEPALESTLELKAPAKEVELVTPKKPFKYKWLKKSLTPPDTAFTERFSEPPEIIPSPSDYFKKFISDECFENIALETNIYALQKDGKEICITKEEIEQFFGILLFTGIYSAATYRMYWETHSRISLIADVMPRNRFETILRFVHFNDNSKMKQKTDDSYDPLFKVRPLLQSLKEGMSKLEPEENHSVDEQMIPFKGRSSMKQYMKNKPHKWGYKVFTRAGVSGLVYDFEIYTGSKMNLGGNLSFSGNVVLRLVQDLKPNCNFKVFFDNWFTSVDLLHNLSKKKIWCAATIRANRLGGCTLADEKDLKKRGRGSYDFRSDSQSGITIVKWFDNKSVHVTSSYCGIEPLGSCKRWSKSERKYIDVVQPKVIREYNPHMGGVDLCDMLIELYRIDLRSKRWYMRIVYFCFDLAVVNGWTLYKRHMLQHGAKKFLSLKDFRCSVAQALTKAGKGSRRKRGRPSLDDNSPAEKKSHRVVTGPIEDVRFDGIRHWPSHTERKQRCKYCPNGYSRIFCSKCKVSLCLNKNNNCFIRFHSK